MRHGPFIVEFGEHQGAYAYIVEPIRCSCFLLMAITSYSTISQQQGEMQNSSEAAMSDLLKSSSQKILKKPAYSEEEQAKINEVRGFLGDLKAEMPGFLSDGTIRRFLRARNWSTAQATKTLKDAVKWRRHYKPDKICWEDLAERDNELKRAYIPDYLDKSGRSVLVSLLSLKSLISTKEQTKQLVYNLENLAMSSEDAQEENVVWLMDFRGWTVSSAPPLAQARDALHIIQSYYPGLIAVAVLCNPPMIFESFWKLMSYFVEAKLKEKVTFVYTNNSESQKTIVDMFNLDKLESTFGGRNTSGFDIVEYSERMRKRDQLRGASARAHSNTSSS